MKYLKESELFLLVILLLTLSIFSLSRYAPLLKAKQELERQNKEARAQLSKLRTDLDIILVKLEEQKSINQEVSDKNINLEADVTKLQQDLIATSEQLELLTSSLLALNRENAELKADKRLFSQQLDAVVQDYKNILAKTDSIKELKQMIQQIRQQLAQNKVFLLKKLDEKKLAEGNHGFVVKDGKDTHGPRVYIEVTPAS